MQTFQLWDNVPGQCTEAPVLEYYPAQNKKSDATVVILPGGGYHLRAQHEGKGYAEYFNSIGMDAFVCEYRVSPHRFPLPLLDARRAMRFVRANAEKFGIDAEKIAIMGSSAGGHLAALTSTYTDPIDFEGADEIDRLPYMPNATVLCYPVICSPDSLVSHAGSFKALLGDDKIPTAVNYSCDRLVNETTPEAFIWHTSDDETVNVTNSLNYGAALRRFGKKFELHVFPSGKHGLGLAESVPHVAQWSYLLKNWLIYRGWLEA